MMLVQTQIRGNGGRQYLLLTNFTQRIGTARRLGGTGTIIVLKIRENVSTLGTTETTRVSAIGIIIIIGGGVNTIIVCHRGK